MIEVPHLSEGLITLVLQYKPENINHMLPKLYSRHHGGVEVLIEPMFSYIMEASNNMMEEYIIFNFSSSKFSPDY